MPDTLGATAEALTLGMGASDQKNADTSKLADPPSTASAQRAETEQEVRE